MTIEVTSQLLRSTMIKVVVEWWDKHKGDDIPDRSQFDPADFKPLLPNILLCDVQHEPFESDTVSRGRG